MSRHETEIEQMAAIVSRRSVLVARVRYLDALPEADRCSGVCVPNESSSLDVILEEARRVFDVQLHHFEALDSRSGIVLGFAGTLVALARDGGAFILLGRATAATAALFALLGFAPRWFPAMRLRSLFDKYSEVGAETIKVRLISAHIEFSGLARRETEAKARRLRAGTVLLVAAVFLIAIGRV